MMLSNHNLLVICHDLYRYMAPASPSWLIINLDKSKGQIRTTCRTANLMRCVSQVIFFLQCAWPKGRQTLMAISMDSSLIWKTWQLPVITYWPAVGSGVEILWSKNMLLGRTARPQGCKHVLYHHHHIASNLCTRILHPILPFNCVLPQSTVMGSLMTRAL